MTAPHRRLVALLLPVALGLCVLLTLPEAARGTNPSSPTAPGIAAPGIAAPGIAAPGIAAPGIAAPGIAAPGINDHVLIDGDSIRLADVFTDAGQYGDRVVARAPAPGHRMVLEATWLFRVARAYRLGWQPANRFQRVVVERTSRIVSPGQLAEAILDSLRERDAVAGEAILDLDNTQRQIHLPVEFPATVTVESVTFDHATRRFAARIAAPDQRPGAIRLSITGQVHALVEVPVLARRVAPGQRIREDDIAYQQMRADRLDPRTILGAEEMIGMTPRRPLLENRAVRTDEVAAPRLVARGSRVTVLFQTAAMRLTATGKALEHGAEGESVRVQNTHSNKIIDGVVVGPDLVVVHPEGDLALQ